MVEFFKAPEAEVDADEEAEEVIEQANPAAMALTLSNLEAGKKLPPEAARFLERQAHMLELQMENLHEQRGLQLNHMRWRRWRDRFQIAVQGVMGMVAFAAVIVLGITVWQAIDDHGLVIEGFSVPPDLAQRGLTGQVVATKLLDKVTAMQLATDSARSPATYSNDWGEDIKVEIPETGVSIDELKRYLHETLGHATHISGEVVHTDTGLEVSARTGPDPGGTFDGPNTDLDKLLQQAAEVVYKKTQPYRYGFYLYRQGRAAEADTVFHELELTGSPRDAEWARLGSANVLLLTGDINGREQSLRALAARYPKFVMGMMNFATVEDQFGHAGTAMNAYRAIAKLVHGGKNPDVTKRAAGVMEKMALAAAAEHVGDFQEAARLQDEIINMPEYNGSVGTAQFNKESDLTQAHDVSGAARVLNAMTRPADATIRDGLVFSVNQSSHAMSEAVTGEDWGGAAFNGAQAISGMMALGPQYAMTAMRVVGPQLALAKARTGDAFGAAMTISQAPNDCYLCLRMRGDIAAASADWKTADHWYAEAVRLAPTLPFAYADWGKMLLIKRDPDGAIVKLREAHKLGPHFADPLEFWAEALMRKGDYSGAIDKLKQAAVYAPRWGRLHMAWGRALAKSGKPAEAKEQYAKAASLDLSVEDRALLATLQAGRK